MVVSVLRCGRQRPSQVRGCSVGRLRSSRASRLTCGNGKKNVERKEDERRRDEEKDRDDAAEPGVVLGPQQKVHEDGRANVVVGYHGDRHRREDGDDADARHRLPPRAIGLAAIAAAVTADAGVPAAHRVRRSGGGAAAEVGSCREDQQP